ncbi:MAG: hypothetical protein KME60_03360 [Cyanomargarita calcarea GSE-NOS-MK-12-04C]|jgi:hypothetical protein|uniref:Uncharacterized protein n=1 Tax=Cyanomargarita calcarea GSE-NOS-MK-12-04C TaxID=2839659 RepID=A0A951UQY9_9CYAN|nr:hypothetical protein [Cyanomargarita calcarea GSE-NOS-MK-12-04C]
MQFSHDLLIDSRETRVQALNSATNEHAITVLNKAKAVVLAVWEGIGIATTAQVAEYYEVSDKAIKHIIERNGDEFAEEVRLLTGKELQDVRSKLELSPRTPKALAWNARGFLRVGLMLRDSLVAKALRDLIVNAASANQPQLTVQDKQHQIQLNCLAAIAQGLNDSVNILVDRVSQVQQALTVQASSNHQQTNQHLSMVADDITEHLKSIKEAISSQPTQIVNIVPPVKEKRSAAQDRSFTFAVRSWEKYDRWAELADKAGMSRSQFFYEIVNQALEGGSHD